MSAENTRRYWVNTLIRISNPVLKALSEQRLKLTMPVEGKLEDRPKFTYLEALARTLVGMAPWLEGECTSQEEKELKKRYGDLARKSIASAVDPNSADYMNFSEGFQPIVDAAFLSHAIIRAPRELWEKLEERDKNNLVAALKATRTRKPYFNNWLLFAAMIETALFVFGEDWDPMRVDYALKQHEQWYLGDGVYGDGPQFHWDYYNSFVIQPMLVDIVSVIGREYEEWDKYKSPIVERSRRYAAIQERLISPEGTYPPIGRSIAYRSGAFQALAQSALRKELSEGITPAQVRCALTAVIKKCMDAPGTFDDSGWLTIGLCGHQPGLGEEYISTGSLYLCTTAFLPLGLSEEDSFWSDDDEMWTAQKIWSGQDMKAEHALS